MLRILVITVACLTLAVCLTAQGQTLYKQVDKDGNVTYTDKPAGRDGKASTLDFDKDLNVTQSPPKAGADEKKSPVDERIKKRLDLRDNLRAAVESAEARLEAAKLALANERDPRDEEWQRIINTPDNGGKPNAAGAITARGGQIACSKAKNPDGSERIFCPTTAVPNEDYSNRMQALEQAVAKAEDDLHTAQQAYRRNAPD
jgi:Domain of unknown function (DUF4124)